VTQHDRHSQRLIVDLIANREKIFKELKRQSRAVSSTVRPESLDESHRRERYEARSRAVSAAAKSPRLAPADMANGGSSGGTGDKSPGVHSRRISGISGILANRAPISNLEPGDSLQLDGTLPSGGDDGDAVAPAKHIAATTMETGGPVEVTVTDESASLPMKKPSLGRSHRIGGRPTGGLQRHLKRESFQATEISGDVHDRDAASLAASARSSEGARYSVTLTDGPARG
jgi:hypothetical protein